MLYINIKIIGGIMGKQALIIVFLFIAIVGGIFVALSQKQTKAIDVIVEQSYSKQARHIANTFAHTGLSELRENLTLKNNIMPSYDQQNVLDIVGSKVSLKIETDSYENIPLAPNDYAIISIGKVTSPEGITYTARTSIVYSHAEGMPDFYDLGNSQYIHLSGNEIKFYSAPGKSFNANNWNNPHLDATVPISAFDSFSRVIVSDRNIRIKGTLNAPVTIVSGGEIWIDDDIISTHPVHLKATKNIVIAKPESKKELLVQADLFTKASIVHEHKNQVKTVTYAGTKSENLALIEIPPDTEISKITSLVKVWEEKPIVITR